MGQVGGGGAQEGGGEAGSPGGGGGRGSPGGGGGWLQGEEVKLKQNMGWCNVSAPSPPLRCTPNGEITSQFARPGAKL